VVVRASAVSAHRDSYLLGISALLTAGREVAPAAGPVYSDESVHICS
jgi:hypothetical protein